MIIDCHYHLMPVVPEGVARHFAEHVARAARIMGKPVAAEAIVEPKLRVALQTAAEQENDETAELEKALEELQADG